VSRPDEAPRVGLEPVDANLATENSLRNKACSGAAESGAVLPDFALVDSDLTRLASVWPNLAQAEKRQIMAIVESCQQ
jgi:hypothetical protein